MRRTLNTRTITKIYNSNYTNAIECRGEIYIAMHIDKNIKWQSDDDNDDDAMKVVRGKRERGGEVD